MFLAVRRSDDKVFFFLSCTIVLREYSRSSWVLLHSTLEHRRSSVFFTGDFTCLFGCAPFFPGQPPRGAVLLRRCLRIPVFVGGQRLAQHFRQALTLSLVATSCGDRPVLRPSGALSPQPTACLCELEVRLSIVFIRQSSWSSCDLFYGGGRGGGSVIWALLYVCGGVRCCCCVWWIVHLGCEGA